jgi:hypothetical protein
VVLLLVALGLAALFVLVGGTIDFHFGTEDNSRKSASTAPITIPTPDNPATNTARVEAAGVSFEYPGDWDAFTLTAGDLEAQRAALARQNPQLAAVFDANAAVGLAKFFAADLGAAFRGEPASNIAVLGEPSGGFPSSIEDFEHSARQQVENAGGTVLGVSETKIDGQTAYRVDLTVPLKLADGTQIAYRQAQLFTPLRGGVSDVVVTSTNDDRGAAIIDAVLRTVHRI